MNTATVFKTGNTARVFFLLILVFCLISELVKAQTSSLKTVQKVVILGDSLTEGYGVSQTSAFPYLLQKKFDQENIPLKIISSGSSGSTSASGLQRIKWIAKDKPDFVLLLLGSNDGLRGLSINQTEKNLNETVAWAKNNNIKIAIGQLHVPPNYTVDYGKKFEKMYSNVAKKQKIELAPFLLTGVAGIKDLNLADGIHPNEKGHVIVANNLYPFLKSWIKK